MYKVPRCRSRILKGGTKHNCIVFLWQKGGVHPHTPLVSSPSVGGPATFLMGEAQPLFIFSFHSTCSSLNILPHILGIYLILGQNYFSVGMFMLARNALKLPNFFSNNLESNKSVHLCEKIHLMPIGKMSGFSQSWKARESHRKICGHGKVMEKTKNISHGKEKFLP